MMNVQQRMNRVDPGLPVQPRGSPPGSVPEGGTYGTHFADELQRATAELLPSSPEPKLSAHAQQRIAQRDIAFGASDLQSIRQAMDLLASKGAHNALLLRADAAFVVNVPHRTVITAISGQELQQRVFTQIDSAVLLQPASGNPAGLQ